MDKEKKQTETSQLNISGVCVAELEAHHIYVIPFTNRLHSISIYRKLTHFITAVVNRHFYRIQVKSWRKSICLNNFFPNSVRMSEYKQRLHNVPRT
jgi:hypothetical protein